MSDAAAQFALTDEQRAIRSLARDISESEFKPNALKWEEAGEFPWHNMKVLADAGLLGASVPEEYGGGGGTWLDAVVIMEEIARCCMATALAAMGELGVHVRSIAAFGSEAQKALYLPRVVTGELILAICITEPETGSDMASMSTTAKDDGDDLIVNGTKMLISRADVAGLFVTYVKFADEPGPRNVGAVLIERDTPGVTVGQTYPTLGGESLFEVKFDNVRVPKSATLVRQNGMRRMLAAFNGQRCINAAMCVGIAQGAQDEAVAYAQQRHQGGHAISEYQGIKWMLADNAIEIEAARALVHRAAASSDPEFPSRYDAAVAKVLANEMGLRVTDRVMQIFGGHGYLREMPAERYLRWARFGALGGGTPQIQRDGIARTLLRNSHAAS